MCGVVVEKVRCKGEVAGSKPVDHVVHGNWLRVVTLVEWAVTDRWGPLRIFFLFSIFKICFLKTFMPCVFLTLGKLFAMCPINGTRQMSYLPTPICRVSFAVCNTRKGFAVGILVFAVCLGHTAKDPFP